VGAFWVLGLGLLLIGCSLGLDEDQIASGAGGAPPGTTTAGTGQATTGSPASTASSSGTSSSSTSSAVSSSTVASSSSTGIGGAVVACLSGDSVVMCQPGEVCCVTNFNAAACSAACSGNQLTWACDGPEDCPGGVCCAPSEEDGDIACDDSCIDDETVCKSGNDCNDLCTEHFPGSLSDQYSTCG
jgi:hypothetical protein